MESWRTVWRQGLAPLLPTTGLEALLAALKDDDPALVQGMITCPPPMLAKEDWPVEACCAVGLCGWKGEGRTTTQAVEDFFADVVLEADLKLGEPAAVRWFLNWFDDTPRHDMRRELIPEVELELELRRAILAPKPEFAPHA